MSHEIVVRHPIITTPAVYYNTMNTLPIVMSNSDIDSLMLDPQVLKNVVL